MKKSLLGSYRLGVFGIVLGLICPGFLLGQDSIKLKIDPKLAMTTEHKVKDSSVTIIHILKLPNRMDLETISETSAFGAWVEKSEQECYQILMQIKQATRERNLYIDGVTPEMEEDILTPTVRSLRDLTQNKRLNEQMLTLMARHKRYSAPIGLAYEDHYDTRGIEDFDLLMKQIYAKGQNAELAVIAERDRYAVEQLACKPGIKILAWDARHRFLSTIMDWNKKHPEKRISLIEITPRSIPYSLQEFRSELKKVEVQ